MEETNTQLLEGNSPHGSGMRAQLSFDMQYYRSRAEAILYEQEA